MGTLTDVQLCYGIALEEETEQPWGEQDIDDWWLKDVCKYVPPFVCLMKRVMAQWPTSPEEEEINKYYKHKRAFSDAHPCPVNLIYHCSGEYPMFILSVGQHYRACRGDLQSIDPEALKVSAEDAKALSDFVKEHKVATTGGAGWLLTSYWR